MSKQEAVDFLKTRGVNTALIDGVVMVAINNTGTAFDHEYRKIYRDLRAAGYCASFGARSCEKLETK